MILAGYNEEKLWEMEWHEFISRYQTLQNVKHIEKQFTQQLHFAYSMANDGKNKIPHTEVPFPYKEERVSDIIEAREKFWKEAPVYQNIKNLI